MDRLYIYKMTVDDGVAPCVRDGLDVGDMQTGYQANSESRRYHPELVEVLIFARDDALTYREN